MADDGRADCNHDRRFRALVLLATFASLRWGEVTALRRCDLDLGAGTVRVRVAFVERSTGEILLGAPKSKAGRRIVGIPSAILPALHEHLSIFVKAEPGALVFPGTLGGPLRRSNFNKMSAWPYAVRSIGANCTLIAREINMRLETIRAQSRDSNPGLGLRSWSG